MLVSAELEYPVVSLRDGQPAHPSLFTSVWEKLAENSWNPVEFGVTRECPQEATCINSAQSIVTDTGSTIELVPSPSESILGVARQLPALQDDVRSILDSVGYTMLGCGVHPNLRAVPADYYWFRTPRACYDYAIEKRSWHHWSIVNIAAAQEVVDVSFEDAPRAVRLLHRLSGLMNFVLRNDPDINGDYKGVLSVRPCAWREHVPRSGPFASDAGRVCVPSQEICSWRDYLSLLWEQSAMFLVGTKNTDSAYLPEHPTFMDFLKNAPKGGWPAKTLSGEEIHIFPEHAHIEQTDWTYMGFARIRWKWREEPAGIEDLLDSWRRGEIETYLSRNLEKVVVENRSNSTQQPGESLVSLALVSGLLANLEEALELAFREPYSFWLSVLDASMTEPLDTSLEGRSIPGYARDMVDIARRGLKLRGEEDADTALNPLYQRIEDRCSPSERLLRDYQEGGIKRLIERLRI
jgi:gamma-glutamylcysteine synthetase